MSEGSTRLPCTGRAKKLRAKREGLKTDYCKSALGLDAQAVLIFDPIENVVVDELVTTW